MSADKQIPFATAASMNWRRVKRQISVISSLLVLSALAVAAPSRAPAPQTAPPVKTQKPPTLDQILDNITKSDLNHEGLRQSNLAIDQLVKKADDLSRKTAKERDKESSGKDPQPPGSKVLGQAILSLTDATSYLRKLQDLQNALIAVRAPSAAPAANAHQTCKDLNLKFKAISTDLNNLKLGIKTLPLAQRAIADLILWDVESQLNSAIDRIRQRTIQVGSALNLKSELDLKDH
jgi:hypothetical protein